MERKLTLVCASAGFGKTTLVSEWVKSCGRPAAWLSLDEGDHDFTRFMTHVAAALQNIDQSTGKEVLGLLSASPPLPPELILTTLLNDLSALAYNCILVLDDYHVVHASPIDEAISFLLEHLPPQIHLVLITREYPQLSLGRARAGGHLSELRDADLRFSSGEAADFLNQSMGLSLSADEINALESRTEGWIAGLQLAALSMQGNEDIPGFIRSFTGDNRYIIDYLAEEVLQRQPEPVRDFLLQTSILDRLYGPLCDAVTGGKDGSAQLESLERNNFFVVPLDESRKWYRYHHLFAGVLYSHLRIYQPERIAELHRRASVWYEQQGAVADSVRHALNAEDFTRAAELIERSWPELRRTRQETAALGWLKTLPEEIFRCRPVLSVVFAWALLASGELEAVEHRLSSAELWLDTSPGKSAVTESMTVVNQEEFRRLQGTIAGYRSASAQAAGDIAAAIYYAHRVLEWVPDDDYLRRGAASALLGLAAWSSGDLIRAYQMFYDGMANVERAGNISDAVGGTIALADISIAQGRLAQAARVYERGLQIAANHGHNKQVLRGTADIYVGLSELCCERNELDAAIQHLLTSKESGESSGFPQNHYRWKAAMAGIKQAQGDLSEALVLLDEAEKLYTADFFPDVRPLTAQKIRVQLAQGRLVEGLDWIRDRGLTAGDDLSYIREFEHITLARILLAQYKLSRQEEIMFSASDLLNRLLREAEQGGRNRSRIEILMLQAVAEQTQGNIQGALITLEAALKLAEPEGYVRIFLNEGDPVLSLLHAASDEGITLDYVHRLLAFSGKSAICTAGYGRMSEPLSEREYEVLRLLSTEMSGPDIARTLYVSLNTLRTHTKNIYAKLGVNNRRTALRRANELGLL
ncbi:LuxR C-terminal-related transcriptional regulator [Paenibacillus sp. PK3_47]|uniref:LuxR C-terminal-related transcriptional regulator n=1 Tax=Paenibacillus sp. PK3_47 TaxID=2072642 RepID=UPI00201D974F|nr:LuxR C-terminal-related transcriptional regulator [Paenibacillus sp. PK3_47]